MSLLDVLVPFKGQVLAAIGIAALLAIGVQSWRASHFKALFEAEQSAHKTDVYVWRQAGILATTRAKLHTREVEAKWKDILDDETNALRTQRDTISAHYRELRQTLGAPSGGTELVVVPFNPAADPGFGSATACVAKYLDLAEAAQLDAVQVIRLQDAYNKLREVPTSQ